MDRDKKGRGRREKGRGGVGWCVLSANAIGGREGGFVRSISRPGYNICLHNRDACTQAPTFALLIPSSGMGAR